jgi:hypothetical protein
MEDEEEWNKEGEQSPTLPAASYLGIYKSRVVLCMISYFSEHRDGRFFQEHSFLVKFSFLFGKYLRV